MKKIILILLLATSFSNSKAQILKPVTWSYGFKKTSATQAVVFIKATIDDGWHVYSQSIKEGGPVKTTITFETGKFYTLAGKTIEPAPIKKYEKAFNMEVAYFEHSVIFQQKITIKGKKPVDIKGTVEFMTCNDKQCLPPDNVEFSIPVK